MHSWTFSQKIIAGFMASVLFTVIVSVVAMLALNNAIEAKDRVISTYGQALIDAERMATANTEKRLAVRGYLLDGDAKAFEEVRLGTEKFDKQLSKLRSDFSDAEVQRLLDDVGNKEKAHSEAIDRTMALRKSQAPLDDVVKAFTEDMAPKRMPLVSALDAFVSHIESQRDKAKDAANAEAEKSKLFMSVITFLAVVCSVGMSWFLARSLTKQIGSGVQHLQSSSTELQSAATQQATGAKEQASAMSEIATTISELLATSKQIAEGAQRVAHIAEQTANAARLGNDGLAKSQSSVSSIKKQVDLIVMHMLDLGKKSQQIGGILEIINELSEQTNILAINATIEAAGAGEVGKRFSVVADEIRKLADRVGGSTKEIRSLIDEIRAAVNTTVMTTEGGTKTVDAGVKQISEITVMFQQIVDLVSTTTEASREIELSTKQQASAVEQVTIAVSNVSQATKEAEVSSNQTLQTAAQLSILSRDLAKIVQSQVAA